MNLTLVAPSIGAGGAERVLQLLARGFSARGHRVSVITTTSRPDFFQLPDGVGRTRVELTGQPAGEGLQWRRVPRTALRAALRLPQLRGAIMATAPDLVIAFMDQINILVLALVGGRSPVVVTEHNDPTSHPLGGVWRLLRRLSYHRAACLVTVSRGVNAGFSWLPAERRRVIYNPIDIDPVQIGPASLPPGFWPGQYVVAMGRLVRQKGFDLLIDAFATVRKHCPEWRLAIVGDGPERPRLDALVRSHDLRGLVALLGLQAEPFPFLKAAGFFVLPSRWEGFANVLAEAMACGLPAVSFDCPSGPAEIVTHGEDGLLVPRENVEALAGAMIQMIRAPDMRNRMAVRALASATRFSLDQIVDQWEQQVFSLALPRRDPGRGAATGR